MPSIGSVDDGPSNSVFESPSTSYEMHPAIVGPSDMRTHSGKPLDDDLFSSVPDSDDRDGEDGAFSNHNVAVPQGFSSTDSVTDGLQAHSSTFQWRASLPGQFSTLFDALTYLDSVGKDSSSLEDEENGIVDLQDKKRLLLDRVVITVARWIHSRFDYIRRHDSDSDEPSGTPDSTNPPSSANSSSNQESGRVRGKRKARDNGNASDGDNDDSREHKPQKRASTKGNAVQISTFACPYFKYDPVKYGKQGQKMSICGSHSWPDTH